MQNIIESKSLGNIRKDQCLQSFCPKHEANHIFLAALLQRVCYEVARALSLYLSLRSFLEASLGIVSPVVTRSLLVTLSDTCEKPLPKKVHKNMCTMGANGSALPCISKWVLDVFNSTWKSMRGAEMSIQSASLLECTVTFWACDRLRRRRESSTFGGGVSSQVQSAGTWTQTSRSSWAMAVLMRRSRLSGDTRHLIQNRRRQPSFTQRGLERGGSLHYCTPVLTIKDY